MKTSLFDCLVLEDVCRSHVKKILLLAHIMSCLLIKLIVHCNWVIIQNLGDGIFSLLACNRYCRVRCFKDFIVGFILYENTVLGLLFGLSCLWKEEIYLITWLLVVSVVMVFLFIPAYSETLITCIIYSMTHKVTIHASSGFIYYKGRVLLTF